VAALPLAFLSDAVEFFLEIIVFPHYFPMLSHQPLTFLQEPLHGFYDLLLATRWHSVPQR
jgi:hypothetical protein